MPVDGLIEGAAEVLADEAYKSAEELMERKVEETLTYQGSPTVH